MESRRHLEECRNRWWWWTLSFQAHEDRQSVSRSARRCAGMAFSGLEGWAIELAVASKHARVKEALSG